MVDLKTYDQIVETFYPKMREELFKLFNFSWFKRRFN